MSIPHRPYNKIAIITPAKVGSSSFLYSLKGVRSHVEHGHSLRRLRTILEESEPYLIIAGVRDPVARNLSYFFQTHRDNYRNDVKMLANNYQGEYCYIPSHVNDLKTDQVIDFFLNWGQLYSLNDWMTEFLEITQINTFDQVQGYQFYERGPHTLLVYTLEKLNENEETLKNYFGIPRLIHGNDAQKRDYASVYRAVKEEIIYPPKYLQILLDAPWLKIFYDSETRQKWKSTYYP